jgi:hypothetical protein
VIFKISVIVPVYNVEAYSRAWGVVTAIFVMQGLERVWIFGSRDFSIFSI